MGLSLLDAEIGIALDSGEDVDIPKLINDIGQLNGQPNGKIVTYKAEEGVFTSTLSPNNNPVLVNLDLFNNMIGNGIAGADFRLLSSYEAQHNEGFLNFDLRTHAKRSWSASDSFGAHSDKPEEIQRNWSQVKQDPNQRVNRVGPVGSYSRNPPTYAWRLPPKPADLFIEILNQNINNL